MSFYVVKMPFIHKGKNTSFRCAYDIFNIDWEVMTDIFSELQEDTLQSFRLPRPVLCIGGIFQVELIGRVQTQAIDSLYYIW